MKQTVDARLVALTAIMLGAVGGVAPAAEIEYVNVSTNLIPGVPSLRYSSTNGLLTQGGTLPGNSVTFDSSPDLLGQTSAFVSAIADQVNGSQSYHTEGYASADLATGKVALLASSVRTNGNNPSNGRADSSATMRDAITFDNTTGSAVAIDVFVTMDGVMDIGDPGWASTFLRFCLGANCHLAGNTILSNVLDYYFTYNTSLNADGHYLTMPTTGWVSASFLPGNDPENMVFHGKYLVPAGASTAELYARMALSCAVNTACDYTHTGALSLDLPTGVTFTSQSGVLLSATGGNDVVPEPGTYAMLGLGLAGLAAGRRRLGLTRPRG